MVRFTSLGPVSLCLLLISFSQTILADDDWSVRGYLKSFALAQDALELNNAPPELDTGDRLYQSQNSLRLMFAYFHGDSAAFEIHYEVSPIYYSSPVEQDVLAGSTFAIPAVIALNQNHFSMSIVLNFFCNELAEQNFVADCRDD